MRIKNYPNQKIFQNLNKTVNYFRFFFLENQVVLSAWRCEL